MAWKIGMGLAFGTALLIAQAPDNTKQNEKDRKSGALTAEQQKETTEDRALTQKIRKAVVDAEGMSTYAKNVKIISRNGKVALRGPVNTAEEKKRIEDLAKAAAGDGNVVNELDVKGGSK